jgi:hypothetical protein
MATKRRSKAESQKHLSPVIVRWVREGITISRAVTRRVDGFPRGNNVIGPVPVVECTWGADRTWCILRDDVVLVYDHASHCYTSRHPMTNRQIRCVTRMLAPYTGDK